MPNSISIIDFKNIVQNLQGDVLCIDVRTPAEYRSKHIKGVINIPLDTLNEHIETLKQARAIYVHCRTGSRATAACANLATYNLPNIIQVDGGIDELEASGLPVQKGKQAISIFRQVQIAAGSLTLIGVVFGFILNPAWFYLAGFVGAGLLFAGITNTCAMGTCLTKMPWNK